MDYQFLTWALILGALSAASLPLGSALGLVWHPANKITGLLTAFGGGALIAALSIELIAPTAIHLLEAEGIAARNEASHNLINMLIGAIVGGLIFVLLDNIVNSKGGFLRNTAATISFLTNRKAARRRQLIKNLASSELIRHLPMNLIEDAVNNIREITYSPGEEIFVEGDPGDLEIARRI